MSRTSSRRSRGFFGRVSFAALMVAFGAVPALTEEADAQSVSGDTNAVASEDVDGGEIVVTATRRATNLQDTPIAISVMGAEQLKNQQITSLLDIGSSMPSLRISTFESRSTALTVGIRGIVPNDANQPAREQGVGVYLDGVYLGRQQGLNAAMLDLERVEVLRGPQGTLFGRNTQGGAVNLITRRPSGEFGLRMGAGIANYDGYNADLHLDLPQVAGVSIKIDGALEYHDATTRNPLEGQTGWNYQDRRGMRVAALWEPTDSVNVLYAYDVGHGESTPFLSQLITYNPNNLPVSSVFPRPAGTISPLAPNTFVRPNRVDVADVGVVQQPSIDESFGHSLFVNWDLTPHLELRSITSYREVEVQQYDNAGGPARPPVFQPNAPVGDAARNFSRYSLSDLRQLQRSQEFQLVGSAFEGRLDYLIGLYYFNEKAQEEAATPSSMSYVGSDGTAVVRDPRTAGILRGFRAIDRGSVATAESRGLFVHTVYTPPVLNDALHITLGGRFTQDEKQGTLYRVSNTARDFRFTLSEDRFDPVVTLGYDLTPDVNIYGTYSTGYRAGGANSRSLTYTPFSSEEVTNYEIGLKSEWFDRLTVNLALFSMDRTNSQIEFTLVARDPVTGNFRNTVETVNAPGTTKIEGVELETVWYVTDALRLAFSYAYTDTSVPNALNPFPASANCTACGTVQPVYIIYTPPHAASLSLDYTYPMSFANLRVHLDANYSQGTQSFETFAQETDDAFLVNGRVALADWQVSDDSRVTFSVWSRNLLDADYVYRRSPENRTGTNAIGDYANFNEPRTFGAQLNIEY